MAFRVGEFVIVRSNKEGYATQFALRKFRSLNSPNIPLIGIVEIISINNKRPEETTYTLRMPYGYGFGSIHGDDLNNFAARMLESIDQTLASELFEIAVNKAT